MAVCDTRHGWVPITLDFHEQAVSLSLISHAYQVTADKVVFFLSGKAQPASRVPDLNP